MYREFYEVVCTTANDSFDRELFLRVLSASGLSRDVLSQACASLSGGGFW